MGNKASNHSSRTTHQQQWPSAQSARGAGAVGSNQQPPSPSLSIPLTPPAALPDHGVQRIHEPLNNQPPSLLSRDPSHPPRSARTLQSRRADEQVSQPRSWQQTGAEQRQLIPLWLSEPSPLFSSDPALPALTARRTPRRRENDYVTFPLQRAPATAEQHQTVPLQPLVPPAVPIAQRSSFSRDSTASYGEAVILRRQEVPSEANAPHCTVDELLDSGADGGAALSPPLRPQRAAAPPLLLSPFQKQSAKPPPHEWEVWQLLASGSCDRDSPVPVCQTDVSVSPSPRQPQDTPVLSAVASTSYGLQRSPCILNVPDLMLKSPAATPAKISASRKYPEPRHHRWPTSEDAHRISPALIAAPIPSTRDESSIDMGMRRPNREPHGVHGDSAVQRRHGEVDEDELHTHIALRERRKPPPSPFSGAAIESYVWAKSCPSKALSAKGSQSQQSIAPRFGSDGDACTAASSRIRAGSRQASSAGISGNPAATPGEFSDDEEDARAGRRWPASEGVRYDQHLESSLLPSTSTVDASTTGGTQRRPHCEPRDDPDGRGRRRRDVKVVDEELLARVAMRQRRWLPPTQLSNEALESYLWAKLRPEKSQSAKSGLLPPVSLSDLGFDRPREPHAANSGFSPRDGSRRSGFSEFDSVAEGYYADTEEDDERRRVRSRFEQECYDAELSQRFAAAAAIAAAPRASLDLFPDSRAPIFSSAGASWASAAASQKSTTAEFVTTTASSRSAPPQVCASLVVRSASTSGTTNGSTVVGLPLCGRLQPQAQVYSSQPMVPK